MKLLLFLSTLVLLSCSHISSSKKTYSGHGAESVSSEDLNLYAPKALAKELVNEIESQQEIRTTGLGQLSPNGKNLFFSWSVTGTSQVWKIDGPMRFPIQLTGGDNPTYLQDITEDGKWLIHSRDDGGNEYPSLYKQSPSGGPLELIFGQDKIKTTYMRQSRDGKYIYFRANNISPTVWGIYKMNLATMDKELLFKGEGYWSITDLGEDGEMLLSHATGNVTNEIYTFNEKTKKLSPLLGQNESESYYVKYSAQKGHYLVQTNKFSDFHKLYLYDTKKFKAISTRESMDVSSFSKSRNDERILILYNNNGRYEIEGISARNYKQIRLPKMSSALHTYFGDSTSNGRYTIFGQSFYNKPRSSFVYDWSRGTLVEWTLPSTPEVKTDHFTQWTNEYYLAEDGTKIPMIVKRPKQCIKKSCPVIISFHGGPEGQSIPSFSTVSEMYASRGFVYVKPNVRGSRGYGKKWLNADNGAKRLDVITDIRDCAVHVQKHWSFDGVVPKIGVTGGSYGGYSTLYAMTVFADYFDAGVARVGMSSLVTFLENTAPHRRYVRETEYGSLEKDRDVLEKLSPINYIDRLKNPLMIIQGVNDPRVPAGESIQFKKMLDSKGIKSTLVLFRDEGHGVKKRKNRTLQTGHTLNFFMENLL
ncbi:prolyl oligopeptidase family serine peptidase [Halobacteriovorax sp. HLS]|uniref:S9 family peptidase n=1 Tax=Halobacteriovorax sp. HLS TaxID=2234000 RepID=UPI000FDA7D80|nr:prolyl oligopeptidase family serine peptidase [Halobacteriovorax sp. HLS]